MKNHPSMKSIVALLGSLAIVIAQADAKPGKGNSGNSGGKGQGKGGNGHSQKADKAKGPDHAGKAAGKAA
jgi:hypothetical protein